VGFTQAIVKPAVTGRMPSPSGRVNVGTDSIFCRLGASRALCRLFSALLGLAWVLVNVEAHAAVPMCSEDGRTIAAPPTGTAVRGLVLEASVPCKKASPLASRSLPAEPGAPIAAPLVSPLRAVPVSFVGVAHAAGERLAVTSEIPVLPAGAGRTIDRPPRA
jgi:hypothetical protein